MLSLLIKEIYGSTYRKCIKIKFSKHFKFQRGLLGIVQNHCRDVCTVRAKEYGNLPNCGVYNLDGESKIRDKVHNGKLDLNNLITLQMLCLNALSTCCLLQGGQ